MANIYQLALPNHPTEMPVVIARQFLREVGPMASVILEVLIKKYIEDYTRLGVKPQRMSGGERGWFEVPVPWLSKEIGSDSHQAHTKALDVLEKHRILKVMYDYGNRTRTRYICFFDEFERLLMARDEKLDDALLKLSSIKS